MPTRSERGAPSFDKNQPNDLIRYFKELETLFTRCDVALDKDKKDYATSYVRSELADSWEAIPEFAATYEEFRDRLFEIYNQVSLKFILSDLDRLIGERQRIGMKSLQDLSEFHMRFYAISSYLMTNQLLSSREQSQSYLRVFDESLQSRILM
jgi:DNA relaxase NicK